MGTIHPAPVSARGQRRVRGWRDVQVTEDRVPHGIHRVGDRVEPGDRGQPGGRRAERVERAQQEEQRHYEHLRLRP